MLFKLIKNVRRLLFKIFFESMLNLLGFVLECLLYIEFFIKYL